MGSETQSGALLGLIPRGLIEDLLNNQYARQIEMYVDSISGGPKAQSEPQQDEQMSNYLHANNFDTPGRVLWGQVVYAFPYANCYKVQLDGMNSDLVCTALMPTSANLGSVRSYGVIAPNTRVVVWWPENLSEGVILGAVAPRIEDGGFVYSDAISQGSNTGFKREAYYNEVMDLCEDDGDVGDFSSHRPLDSVASGDWGYISDSGSGVHIDQFMTYLRMDETCGLYLFYMDHLARLAAYNFDLVTAISERLVRNDSGEGLHFSGFSPYAWEAAGISQPGVPIHQETDDDDFQYRSPRGKLEPLLLDTQPFYRLEEHRGYLGQGYFRQVIIPGVTATQGTVFRYSEADPRFGAFCEQVGLNGAWGVASAHSISLQKRVIIPVPKRISTPEDPQGDDLPLDGDGNYRFAGVFGDGPDHDIQDLKQAEGEVPHVGMAAAATDLQAHMFNWQGLHPFAVHTRDFVVPEQTDMPYVEKLQERPEFSDLAGKDQFLDCPPGVDVRVDHRYDVSTYYETTAGIDITPQGAVVIRDAWGAELRMAGGSIQISAPGDVWLQPGRNMNTYAGDDIIIRANNSIDLTSSLKDVRVKAENNLQMLAGNGGQGGVLIESRSEAAFYDFENPGEGSFHSGIILRAPQSEVVSWSAGVYIRTGSEEGVVGPGDIVLDADTGNSDILTVSRVFDRHLTSAAHDVFPVPDEGVPNTVNTYNSRVSQLQTQLQVTGGVIVREKGIFCRGYIQVLKGHIVTELSDSSPFDGLVGAFDTAGLKKAEKNMEDFDDDFEARKEIAKDYFDTAYRDAWRDPRRPGHAQLIEDAEFSLRTEEEMGTEEFRLVECYWQQLDGDKDGWDEQPVLFHNAEMFPHPGKIPWTEDESWLRMDLKFHDLDDGRDDPRGASGANYQDSTVNELQGYIPQGKYNIISRS